MRATRLRAFQGEFPRVSPWLLSDNQAQRAANLRLTSGDMQPLYYPKRVNDAVLCANPQTVFRMIDAGSGAYYWLSWPVDVDVVSSPGATGDNHRIAFSSDSFEPRTINLAAVEAGSAPYTSGAFVLGVTKPLGKTTVSASGGGGPNEDRAYVYTRVDGWGWESAPSPASDIVTGPADAFWSITGFDAAPPNSGTVLDASASSGVATLVLNSVVGLRAKEQIGLSGIPWVGSNARIIAVNTSTNTVTVPCGGVFSGETGTWSRIAPHNSSGAKRRLYRTVTSSAGTDYYFVKEFDYSVFSVADDAGADIGEPLPSLGWEMPPADLTCLRLHPSGALVGISGNEVCFSEPWAHYAWPTKYRVTVDYPCVGVGVFGTTVVVATAGPPYLVQGAEPLSMSPYKLDQRWPCLSKRSIVDMGYGVAYAAPQGLVLIGSEGPKILSEPLFTFEEWRLLNPSSFNGEFFDGRYHATYTDLDGESGMMVVDGSGKVRYYWSPTAMYSDHETGQLYLADNDGLREWNADFALRMVGDWHSKDFIVANPINLGAARIDGDFAASQAELEARVELRAQQLATNAAAIAASATLGSLNAHSLNRFSLNGSTIIKPTDAGDQSAYQILFSLYVDGALWWQKVVTDNKPFRLPAGEKYQKFSIRLTGPVPIRSVVSGDTLSALGTV